MKAAPVPLRSGKKININYEKLLTILGIIFTVMLMIAFFMDIANDELNIAVGPITVGDDGQPILKPVFERKLYSTLAAILFFIDLIIWCLYGLLKIEKKNNADTYKMNMRQAVAVSIKAANIILAFSDQNDKCLIVPNKWASIKDDPNELIRYRDYLVTEYCKIFDDFCKKVWLYIAPRIREINSNDTINISVKLFFDKDNGEKNVLNLGKALSSGDARELEANLRPRYSDWDTFIADSYRVDEDYAMSFIMDQKHCEDTFRCGNITQFKNDSDNVCLVENSPHRRYRLPSRVVRKFDATLVSPILIRPDPTKKNYKVAGALCVDTTSSYSDWDHPGSYEETLAAFAVSCISSVLLHSMEELEKVNNALMKAT